MKAAKEAGIRVVGIDTEASYSEKLDLWGVGQDRIRMMNFVAEGIIKKEGEGKKWVALMGEVHIGEYFQIPGVSETMNVSSVHINGKKNEETACCFKRESRRVANGFLELRIARDVTIECDQSLSMKIDDLKKCVVQDMPKSQTC